MKHNGVTSIDHILDTDMANLFNIYEDSTIGNFQYVYAINRTFNMSGMENISRKYYNNYIIKNRDTWYTIANDFYGDPRLWWLVCKINGVNNPMIDPQSGDQIIILKKSFVSEILNTIRMG